MIGDKMSDPEFILFWNDYVKEFPRAVVDNREYIAARQCESLAIAEYEIVRGPK